MNGTVQYAQTGVSPVLVDLAVDPAPTLDDAERRARELHAATRRGGPWTRHGHPIDGVTVAGDGRPPVARCGGPAICGQCATDAETARRGKVDR